MPDIVPAVPLEYRWSVNHAGDRPQTIGIVLHSTRSGQVIPLETEYRNAVAWMQRANERDSCAHFCVGPSKVARMISDHLIGWHAREHNQTHLGIEIAQAYVGQTFAESQFDYTAVICAMWCKKYGIPRVRVLDSAERGIIGHEDTVQGRRDGKTDPGPLFPWARFIVKVESAYQRLYGAVIPNKPLDRPEDPFALAGEGIAEYLRNHAEYGFPRKGLVSWDKAGNEYCWTTATTKHAHGCLVVWRKWLADIGRDPFDVMTWD